MFAFTEKNVYSLIYIFVGIINAASSIKLPKGFVQCKLSDPALNECIKNGLTSAFPHLVKGIPSLGLLPTDPMRITSLEMDQGIGAVKLKLKFKDLDIKNMHSMVIKHLTYDPKNYILNFTVDALKPIVLEGFYETNGKVLILPVSGNGTCQITLDDYQTKGILKLKPIVKNGITYLKVHDFKWNFVTSKMSMRFNNLFNGDKALGENLNIFLNENWRELLKEMQPYFEDAETAVFVSMAQQFFDRIPLNQIFLD